MQLDSEFPRSLQLGQLLELDQANALEADQNIRLHAEPDCCRQSGDRRQYQGA